MIFCKRDQKLAVTSFSDIFCVAFLFVHATKVVMVNGLQTIMKVWQLIFFYLE